MNICFEKRCRTSWYNNNNASRFFPFLCTDLNVVTSLRRNVVFDCLRSSLFYGKLAALLSWDTPHFNEYFMAELYARCPNMIPGNPVNWHWPFLHHAIANLHIAQNLSTNDRQSYEADDDKDSPMYQMAHIMLFAAMIRSGHGPIGVEEGWAWLSRTSKTPPHRITPALIYGFLNVASGTMLDACGRHIRNLLEHILTDLCPRVLDYEDIEGSTYIRAFQWRLERYFCAV